MDFSVTVKPSFEEYKIFNRVVRSKLGKSQSKTILLGCILLVIVGLVFLLGEPILAAALLAAWAAALALGYIQAQRRVKKVWDSNAALREGESVFRFTESGLGITSTNGQAHLDYDKLYRLIETDTHFYLMTAINMGSGFPKSLCTPEQQSFIRERCGK